MASHFCREPIIRASFGQLFARMHSQTIPITVHGGEPLIFAIDDDASQAAHFPLTN